MNHKGNIMDLTHYYDLICKQPLLTKEEEFALLDTYHSPTSSDRQKKAARDKLISCNLRFAFKKAKILSNGNMDQFEELISAGNEGLLAAIDKFKPSEEVRFLTYAGWWVRQRQLKQMAMMRLVAVPIWKQQLASRIKKAVDQLDHIPKIEELRELLPEVPDKYLKELTETRYLTFFLEDMPEEEIVEESFLDDLIQNMDEGLLKEKMSEELEPEEYDLIVKTFGLDDGIEVPITDMVKKDPSLRKEDLRKVRRSALSKLRSAFMSAEDMLA